LIDGIVAGEKINVQLSMKKINNYMRDGIDQN